MILILYDTNITDDTHAKIPLGLFMLNDTVRACRYKVSILMRYDTNTISIDSGIIKPQQANNKNETEIIAMIHMHM